MQESTGHESLPNKVGGAEYAIVVGWKLLVLVAKSTLPLILEEILDDPLMIVFKTIGELIFFSHLVMSMKAFRVVATITVIILCYQSG